MSLTQEQKDTIREEIIKALETKKPIQDIILDFYQQGAQDKVEEVSKAYGGCTKCYGKGYATTESFTHYSADFIGYKSYLTENSKIIPCSCDRGNQIKEILKSLKDNT